MTMLLTGRDPEHVPRPNLLDRTNPALYQAACPSRAIDWFKDNYAKPLRIDDLAAHASMSNSMFHHQFRSMTALSPLQFQKQLRLQEASGLMPSERMDAATAAFQVGYESPSQFIRKVNRMFGASLLREITSLRQLAAGERG